MSVFSYMEVQKQRIKLRHVGDEFLYDGERETLFRPAVQILRDINAMPGLNTTERELFRGSEPVLR